MTPESRYRVGRDAAGSPVVLLELEPTPKETARHNAIRLEHFEYEPRVGAYVQDLGAAASHEGQFLLLRCRDAEEDVRKHFFDLVESLVEFLGERPSLEEADRAVRQLVELFRAMSGPSRRTIVGLWAELLLIADAVDPATAAASWHSNPEEQHDFILGTERLEVKATTRKIREHEIALEQLVMPANGVGLLVSFMLLPSDAGVSANDLLSVACSRLPKGSDGARRLRAIFAETIGDAWREAESIRFDLPQARESRAIYDVRSVPSVEPRIPPQVRRVNFTSDLSDSVALEPKEASARSRLAEAMFDH